MIHRTSTVNNGPAFQAICSCGEKSGWVRRQETEDWVLLHAMEVQRIRSQLHAHSPSVRNQHAWFTAQANNPENSEHDRLLWRQLADELEARLRVPDEEQPTLW
jgi:hypothetical protein